MEETKKRIKERARALFLADGYQKTTIRGIAAAAEVNPALVLYYFKNKESLFQKIVEEGIASIAPRITRILDGNAPLAQKIRDYVHTYTDLLLASPDLPLFVMSEMRANPERFLEISSFQHMYHSVRFFEQVEKVTGGQVDPRYLYLNLVALTVFPFIVQPVLGAVYQLENDHAFRAFVDGRKSMVIDTIVGMLNNGADKR